MTVQVDCRTHNGYGRAEIRAAECPNCGPVTPPVEVVEQAGGEIGYPFEMCFECLWADHRCLVCKRPLIFTLRLVEP